MPAADPPGGGEALILVPEVRDYTRINAELVRLLDAGHRRVRLAGADGQRLLAHGLRGDWDAVVVVEGDAGPELASDLDAPRLIVACTGGARDGAGSGLRSGTLLICGDVEASAGYSQRGGTIVIHGAAGPRAGLDQSGGFLIVVGCVDRLAGERQKGGTLALLGGRKRRIGPFSGRGRTGGSLLRGMEAHEAFRFALGLKSQVFRRPSPPPDTRPYRPRRPIDGPS